MHKTIAGGRYASGTYTGVSESEKSWYALYAWIDKNGYECRDEPAFEAYLNAIDEPDPQKFENVIYVPIV